MTPCSLRSSYDKYRQRGTYSFWGAATALSVTVMSAGLAYIVGEYCTQSHLSTEHYGRAMHGLRQTRRYKRYTLVFRAIPDMAIKAGKRLFRLLGYGQRRPNRRSLVWSIKTQGHSNFFRTPEDQSEAQNSGQL